MGVTKNHSPGGIDRGNTVIHALTSEYLVDEDLDMIGRQRLRRDDDLVQVALHQLCDDVPVVRGGHLKSTGIIP